MALLTICFINIKWLQILYYFILCCKNLIQELTYVIVNIYVTVGYFNESIRKLYFIQQEVFSGEHFLRSI